jgi:hypothetical protein
MQAVSSMMLAYSHLFLLLGVRSLLNLSGPLPCCEAHVLPRRGALERQQQARPAIATQSWLDTLSTTWLMFSLIRLVVSLK